MIDAPWTLGLLVGGQSRRFGRPKWAARLPADGPTLLERALARHRASGEGPVLLATRPGGPGEDLGWPVVHDDPPGEGPLVATLALLGAAETEFLLVLPVDAPMLPEALGATMRAAVGDHDVVLLAREGVPAPLPVLLRTSLRPALAAAVAAGARRMNTLATLGKTVQVAVEEAFPEATPDAIFLNVNTPDDLRRAEGLLGAVPPASVEDSPRRS